MVLLNACAHLDAFPFKAGTFKNFYYKNLLVLAGWRTEPILADAVGS